MKKTCWQLDDHERNWLPGMGGRTVLTPMLRGVWAAALTGLLWSGMTVGALADSGTPSANKAVVNAVSAGLAMPPVPDAKSAALVQERLRLLYPNQPVGAVHTTPIPGLFEVQTGSQLSYVDETGRYFIFGGTLVDYPNRVNLSEARLSVLNRIDPSTLPLADAMTFKLGNGGGTQRTLYVFSDPLCPFCQKLERDLRTSPGLTDVTIHVFMFPLDQLHPQATALAKDIWCSPQREQAWVDALTQNKAVVSMPCDGPVQRNIELGQRLNVTGTPTLFSWDGRRMAGAGSLAAIEAFMAGR